MKFIISQNKDLDIEVIEGFYRDGDSLIQESWPEIADVRDIPGIISNEYGPELDEKIGLLRANEPKLQEIAETISQVLGEPWAQDIKIAIYVGACPIAPRFLDTNSFLLPYYHDLRHLLNTAAHEMIHFLYFKKWSTLFPMHTLKNYEYPDPVWVLSEILVAVIGNDPRICEVVGSPFVLYPDWQDMAVGGTKLLDIFNDVYSKSDSFSAFLIESWSQFQKLDKEFGVTKKLTNAV